MDLIWVPLIFPGFAQNYVESSVLSASTLFPLPLLWKIFAIKLRKQILFFLSNQCSACINYHIVISCNKKLACVCLTFALQLLAMPLCPERIKIMYEWLSKWTPSILMLAAYADQHVFESLSVAKILACNMAIGKW